MVEILGLRCFQQQGQLHGKLETGLTFAVVMVCVHYGEVKQVIICDPFNNKLLHHGPKTGKIDA
jgi:hypothetical protein